MNSNANSEVVRGLTENEVKLLSEIDSWGHQLINIYGKGEKIDPSLLDEVFKSWKLDPSEQRLEQKYVIYGLSKLFGDFINNRKDCIWKVIEDEHGSDFMIHSSAGSNIFVKDIVLKRARSEDDEFGFFLSTWNAVNSEEWLGLFPPKP